MVNDNAKAVVKNDGFEYEVEFGEMSKDKECCNRKSLKVNINTRHSPINPFKGFSKRDEEGNEDFKKITHGTFCPICGTSRGVKSRRHIDIMAYDWRNATKDIDEAVRKAWLSLQK